MKLEDVHNCEKSRGKIVGIGVDKLGRTFCGYCNKQVDYRRWMERMARKLGVEKDVDV